MFAVDASVFVPVGLCLFMLVGIIVGYYTKRGSDISQRPSDGLGGDSENAAPGAEGESRIAGRVEGEHGAFDTHGTH